MVSSVSSLPYYSYLSQLQGTQLTSPAPTNTGTAPAAPSNAGDSASLVSSLLGSGGFAPSVLSLLQESGSGSFDPVSSLLGGKAVDTGVTKLLASLYDSQTASSLQSAKLNNTKQAVYTSPLESLISNADKASVAYNQTLQQNAANAVKVSAERTSTITSVIS